MVNFRAVQGFNNMANLLSLQRPRREYTVQQ